MLSFGHEPMLQLFTDCSQRDLQGVPFDTAVAAPNWCEDEDYSEPIEAGRVEKNAPPSTVNPSTAVLPRFPMICLHLLCLYLRHHKLRKPKRCQDQSCRRKFREELCFSEEKCKSFHPPPFNLPLLRRSKQFLCRTFCR